MGIRFRCPNGHKLHVKSFLAGKRGVCPECGLKVQIPEHSTAEFAATRTEPSVLADAVEAPVRTRGQSIQPTGRALKPVSRALSGESPESTHRIVGAESEATDLLGEATRAKWFVRPPAGGQYGPADAVLFRTWIIEGRVTADSYIWRDGWTDWQLAEDLLTQFEGQSLLRATSAADAAEEAPGRIPTIVPTVRLSTTPTAYRQRKSTRSTTMLIILLTLSCAILFAALIYVVRFMN